MRVPFGEKIVGNYSGERFRGPVCFHGAVKRSGGVGVEVTLWTLVSIIFGRKNGVVRTDLCRYGCHLDLKAIQMELK